MTIGVPTGAPGVLEASAPSPKADIRLVKRRGADRLLVRNRGRCGDDRHGVLDCRVARQRLKRVQIGRDLGALHEGLTGTAVGSCLGDMAGDRDRATTVAGRRQVGDRPFDRLAGKRERFLRGRLRVLDLDGIGLLCRGVDCLCFRLGLIDLPGVGIRLITNLSAGERPAGGHRYSAFGGAMQRRHHGTGSRRQCCQRRNQVSCLLRCSRGHRWIGGRSQGRPPEIGSAPASMSVPVDS